MEIVETTNKFEGVEPGMTIRVHQKIKDVNPKGEEKERVQVFEGLVLQRRNGKEAGATVTVRKISNGIGVEKVFPVFLPSIEKVEQVKKIKVRRAKLNFLRTYKRKLKEVSLSKEK